jgi:hypothetical protein
MRKTFAALLPTALLALGFGSPAAAHDLGTPGIGNGSCPEGWQSFTVYDEYVRYDHNADTYACYVYVPKSGTYRYRDNHVHNN